MHRNWLILISCALSSITNAASAPASCPLLGPVYPPPRHASRSLALAKAKNEVVGAFQKFVHGAETPGASVFDPNTTSISLEVFAAGDSSPLLYTSYTATSVRDGTRGVRKVDEDTVFRIGSCSKLWTIFLLLIENGDASFQEPIAKYIPELRDAAKELKHNATEREDGINIMHWNEVTVGELASQLAGLTRDCMIFCP